MKSSEFPFGSDYSNAHLSQITYLDDEDMAKLSNFTKNQKDFLLYLGSPGTGKSYFCAAMKNYLQDQKKLCLYVTANYFYQQLREIISGNHDWNYEVQKVSEYPFVIIDDIKFKEESEKNDWRNEILFTLIDLRGMSRLPTILTSNSYMENIKEIAEPRLFSRLASPRNTIIQRTAEDLRQVYA